MRALAAPRLGIGLAVIVFAWASACNAISGLDGYQFDATSTGSGGASPSGSSTTTSSSSSGAGATGGGGGGTGGGTGGGAGGTDGGADTNTAVWSRSFGDAADQGVTALAVDLAGHVFMGGWFQGTVDFGCGALSSASGKVGYVVAIDQSGGCLWSSPFAASAGDASVTALALDAGGNLTVAGTFEGNLTLPTGGPALSATATDGFVASYSFAPGHSYRWSVQITGSEDEVVNALAADQTTLYAAGSYTGSFTAGSTSVPHTSAAHASNGFLVALDLIGAVTGVRNLGPSANTSSAFGIAAATGHGVAAVGSADGPIAFGTGSPLMPAGGSDAFVVRYPASIADVDPTAKFYGDGEDQGAKTAVFASAGDLFVAGTFQGQIDFGNGWSFNATGGAGVFLARLDPSGTGVQATVLASNSSSAQSLGGMALGKSSVAVAGTLSGAVHIINSSKVLKSAGKGDVYVVEITPSPFSFVKTFVFGDAEDQGADAVAVAPDGSIYVAGHFQGTLDFHETPSSPHATHGMNDIFLAKLAP